MNISKLLQQKIPLIDPHSFTEISIISHGHSDHVAFNPFSKSRIIICTHETAEIIKHRSKDDNSVFIKIDYFEKKNLYEILKNNKFNINLDKDIFIKFYPAGHILGSSQILIETKGEKLLYSGDFKLRKNPSCRSLVIPNEKIDYLIMESTFGKPKYIFPEIDFIKKDIIDFCNKSFKDSSIPIIYAYSLGKSQELVKLLEDTDFQVTVHGSIYHICNIYNKFGINLKNYDRYKRENINSSAINKKLVLIIPPQYNKNKMITNIPNRKVSVATGWAIDNFSKYIYKADAAFPLSDHADYNELIEYAKKINARKTLITHGFALDLAKDLNKLGLNAEPLDTYNPNSLFPI